MFGTTFVKRDYVCKNKHHLEEVLRAENTTSKRYYVWETTTSKRYYV